MSFSITMCLPAQAAFAHDRHGSNDSAPELELLQTRFAAQAGTALWTPASSADHIAVPQTSVSYNTTLDSLQHNQNPIGTARIQCWDHGCNGRAFSSYGNFRRHIRERHTASKKHLCQVCGRAFSRSTARNDHYQQGKCRIWKVDEYGLLVSVPIRDMGPTMPQSQPGSLAAATGNASMQPSFNDLTLDDYTSLIKTNAGGLDTVGF